MQRTTLGVSGLQTAERFSISASALSVFVLAQIIAYVLVQIPAGVMVDRWGSRAMGTLAAAVAAAGQLLMAATTQFGPAVGARALVGAGDALILMAVLAVLPRWFPPGAVPVTTQLTIIFGQAGQILSAVPFLWLLQSHGWVVAFGLAAALSALAAALLWLLVRDTPPGAPVAPAVVRTLGEEIAEVRRVWRRPGTKLGYFGHTATQFPVMVFGLLWGFPYLVLAQGFTPSQASRLLTVLVVVSALVAPVLGMLAARYPHRRQSILLGVALASALAWAVVIALPHQAPVWLLYLLAVVLAFNSPASVVALDIARTANPGRNTAVAQSITNVGGFSATVIVMVAMGMILDRHGGFGLAAFRLAWLAQIPFWLLGIIGIVLFRRRS